MENKTGTQRKWWQNAVVYQIYPRSFQDSNGDGIGDIPGIIRRLDYLADLGIDAVWLSPVYRSPQDDNGYDISDYQDIDPMFGTLEDMEELIREAKKRNIRIVMDLVLNHSSDEHRWFQEAKKSKDNPYHDYYVWRDGKEGVLPNEMKSVFGGPAWEWVPEVGQYYFHQFSVKQPDLNWENEKVRREIYDMILWWMDKGVGGFRLDVIDQIAKEPDLGITNNGPRLHEFIRELSRETFQKGDLITVGEAWGADPERAKLYSNPDGSEFSMVFQFEHICLDQQEGKEKWDLAPLSLVKLKENLAKWQRELMDCGWNSLFWNNHDLPRIAGRDSDPRDLRNLTAMAYFLKGTTLLYAGQEVAAEHQPSLFDRDTVDWTVRCDLSGLMRTLYGIKRDVLEPTDYCHATADDEKDVAVMYRDDVRKEAGDMPRTVGVFSLRGKAARVAVDVADGTYRNLIDASDVVVSDGELACDGEPVIMRCPRPELSV